MGRRERAEEALAELTRDSTGDSGNFALSAAWAHSVLGQPDEAFHWLDRAIEARDPFIVSLPTFPSWDPLRSDPRFDDVMARLNFPEWSYERTARVRAEEGV